MMKVKIEEIPVENRGIDVTSESEEEREHLEELWARRARVVALTRNGAGTVTLTFAPPKEE